jgi:flavin-binding protein dodecin
VIEGCTLTAFGSAGKADFRASLAGAPGDGGYRQQCCDATLVAGRSTCVLPRIEREDDMAESVYKVIELIGTSKESWEKAAKAAVDRAGKSLRDLRVAEVVKLDMQLDAKGKVEAYRAKLNVSFKFEGD